MDTSILLLLICIITAAIYLLLGVLISIGKNVSLIKGVDLSQLTNAEDFCKEFGNGLIVSGIFLLFTGTVFYSNNGLVLFTVLFLVFCNLPFAYFFRAKQKYTKPDS